MNEKVEYPRWLYHRTKGAVIVNNAAEDDALGAGWQTSSVFPSSEADEKRAQEEKQADKDASRQSYRDSLDPQTAGKQLSPDPVEPRERVTTYQTGGIGVTRTAVGELVHTNPELDMTWFPPSGEVKLPEAVLDPSLTEQPNLPVAPKAAVEAAQKGKPVITKPAAKK